MAGFFNDNLYQVLDSTEVAFLLFTQQPGFDVAEIYQQRWLEESEQRLETGNQTILVLDS